MAGGKPSSQPAPPRLSGGAFLFLGPGARAGPLHSLPDSTQTFPPPRLGNSDIWLDLLRPGTLKRTDRTTRPPVRPAKYPDVNLCAIQRRNFHPALRLVQWPITIRQTLNDKKERSRERGGTWAFASAAEKARGPFCEDAESERTWSLPPAVSAFLRRPREKEPSLSSPLLVSNHLKYMLVGLCLSEIFLIFSYKSHLPPVSLEFPSCFSCTLPPTNHKPQQHGCPAWSSISQDDLEPGGPSEHPSWVMVRGVRFP
ncbi:uncharacterized protein LOC115070298 [Nannospalax galili]|uniref:uncharacterized protein LOC115070298 n=1 Tax=Nannospalax galili TaxID=1026970 RepID=UPI00111C472C|nr:uncharacterized protein LOC115070298 [Nannospalax galili]